MVGEALSGLWRVSLREPELADIEGPVAERALCNAGQALEAQSGAEEAAGFDEPGRVEGAWFRDGETRMDDQQHMISALLRTEAIAEAGPTQLNGPAPPFWLWFLVLVAAFNPLRVALAARLPEDRPPAPPDARTVPATSAATPAAATVTASTPTPPARPQAVAHGHRPDRPQYAAAAPDPDDPRPVGRRPWPTATGGAAPPADRGPDAPGTADVALGGAAGAATALVVALLAGPLTNLWHVSPPALRLATGALGLAGGLTALLCGPCPPPRSPPAGPASSCRSPWRSRTRSCCWPRCRRPPTAACPSSSPPS